MTMLRPNFSALALGLLIPFAVSSPLHAASQPRALGTFEAWTAAELAERGGKICYMVARPAKSDPQNVRRGDILLMVTHRQAAKQRDEVSFQSGYPFKEGAPVVMEIDKKRFELFTNPKVDPESAWSRDGAMDKALVEAMRKGEALLVRGESTRNTQTTDTFSLMGFSKAYAEIGKACGVK